MTAPHDVMSPRQKYRGFLTLLRELKHDEAWDLLRFDALVRLLLDIPQKQRGAEAILARRKRAQKRMTDRSTAKGAISWRETSFGDQRRGEMTGLRIIVDPAAASTLLYYCATCGQSFDEDHVFIFRERQFCGPHLLEVIAVDKREELADAILDGAGVYETGLPKRQDRCPRCESPAPHLHPAIQHEGEVHVCEHEFHGPAPQSPTRRAVGDLAKLREENERLSQIIADHQWEDAYKPTLLADITALREENAALRARVGELEACLLDWQGLAETRGRVVNEQHDRFVEAQKREQRLRAQLAEAERRIEAKDVVLQEIAEKYESHGPRWLVEKALDGLASTKIPRAIRAGDST